MTFANDFYLYYIKEIISPYYRCNILFPSIDMPFFKCNSTYDCALSDVIELLYTDDAETLSENAPDEVI